MDIKIKEILVLRVLLSVFLFLFIMNFIVHYMWAVYDRDSLLGFTRLFNFYEEANLPTWYSSLLLSISSAILMVITTKNTQDKKYWLALAFIFIFLSIDETAKIHELIGSILSNTRIQELLPQKESSTWVFFGGTISAIVVVAFFKFWLRQDPKTKKLFFAAAFIYVGGALGFEVIEIYYIPIYGSDTGFFVLSTIEESLEMIGIIIFIYALLNKLKSSNSVTVSQ